MNEKTTQPRGETFLSPFYLKKRGRRTRSAPSAHGAPSPSPRGRLARLAAARGGGGGARQLTFPPGPCGSRWSSSAAPGPASPRPPPSWEPPPPTMEPRALAGGEGRGSDHVTGERARAAERGAGGSVPRAPGGGGGAGISHGAVPWDLNRAWDKAGAAASASHGWSPRVAPEADGGAGRSRKRGALRRWLPGRRGIMGCGGGMARGA